MTLFLNYAQVNTAMAKRPTSAEMHIAILILEAPPVTVCVENLGEGASQRRNWHYVVGAKIEFMIVR